MLHLGRFFALGLVLGGVGLSGQLTDASESRSAMQQAWPVGNTVEKHSLAEIVRLVKTETEFADHSIESNVGSGFVVGKYFLTVYHNLLASRDGYVRQTISVDGLPLSPVFVDAYQDIAVFELSGELCRRYCNELRIDAAPTLEHGRPIYWVRKREAKWELMESTMLNLAVFDRIESGVDAKDPYRCSDNLVVEVEEPFVPGSSGAPVVDAVTGRIIGIIQGSFESDNQRTGYFKPIHCVGFQQALYAPRAPRSPG